MKKTALIALLLSLVVCSSAFAAGGTTTLGVDGAVAMPTSDFGQLFKMGYQGGVFGDYGINEQFALGVGVDYVKVGVKDEYISLLEAVFTLEAGVPVTVDVTESIIPITVYGKWMPPMKGNVAPYIMAGGGYYMMKFDAKVSAAGLAGSGSETVNKPGIFGGAGVDFKANPQVKVGVFAKFHDILVEGGGNMYFNAGVSVGFGLAGAKK